MRTRSYTCQNAVKPVQDMLGHWHFQGWVRGSRKSSWQPSFEVILGLPTITKA